MRRVLAFYQFVPLESPETERGRLQALGDDLGLRGTILVAEEGVNGTVVGDTQALSELSQYLTDQYRVKSQKWSDLESGNSGFHRFKVRVKPEIVSFGVDDLDMGETGEHVDAQAWNALIADPEVIVIDTRNDYEIDIGTFDQGSFTPYRELSTVSGLGIGKPRSRKTYQGGHVLHWRHSLRKGFFVFAESRL
jgi:UPF0176 protein